MFLGNLGAGANQRQAPAAYSSIAHAGYILVPSLLSLPWRGKVF